MLSSISSSEVTSCDRQTRRSIGLIILGIVVIGLACEVASSYGLHRVSKIQGRINWEYHNAATLAAYGVTGKPTMLLFGNSLLLEAVDYPQIKLDLADEYILHRLVSNKLSISNSTTRFGHCFDMDRDRATWCFVRQLTT